MKILFAALKYDYGIQERGYSFEYYSFYDTLIGMGHEVEYFDFYTLYLKYGKHEMTKMLRQRVEEWKPELLFTFLYSDQFDFEELKNITTQTNTITYNWFADDHWRFDDYSRYWAPCFDFVSTTDRNALSKYKAIGYSNVLLTQWAANPRIWTRIYEVPRYDVTFIGQQYGNRRAIIRNLKKQDIPVRVWGTRWKLTKLHEIAKNYHIISNNLYDRVAGSTRISQQEMIKIIQASKINLNISQSSQLHGNQIKGRNFEIPACGGFHISGYTDNLEDYFELDKEIVCYQTEVELIEKIKYYLQHDTERNIIAEAGYQRVMKEHTYAQRFRELFKLMDLN